MGKPFRLQRGMYLVITKVLENETPEVIAHSFSYARVWNYWVDNPGKEWELAMVRTFDVESPEGRREIHQVWRIHRPIPPKRYRQRLLRRMLRP